MVQLYVALGNPTTDHFRSIGLVSFEFPYLGVTFYSFFSHPSRRCDLHNYRNLDIMARTQIRGSRDIGKYREMPVPFELLFFDLINGE